MLRIDNLNSRYLHWNLATFRLENEFDDEAFFSLWARALGDISAFNRNLPPVEKSQSNVTVPTMQEDYKHLCTPARVPGGSVEKKGCVDNELQF